MKSKKMTYILLPVVLIIWGYIGFEVATYGETEEEIEPIRIDAIISERTIKSERKKLDLDYPDPFLQGQKRRKKVENKSPKGIRPSAKKPVKKVQWGEITYSGFIQNKSSQRKIGLLNINGRQVLASKNETTEGLKVLQIRQDSVLLEKENVVKWFGKPEK